MLNFQLRGYLIDLKLFLLDEEDYSKINNKISQNKSNLVELIDTDEIHLGSPYDEIRLPIIHKDSELQITSFNSKDLYDDGYTFYRENPENINKEESQVELIIAKSEYVLTVQNYYYGCVFECDLDNMNYENFDKDKVRISQINYPFVEHIIIDRIEYSQKVLHEVHRSKYDRMKCRILLYKPFEHKDIFIKSNSTVKNLFNPIQFSEKFFNQSN